MDLAPEQLQYLSIFEILKESVSIPRSSPRTFALITLTLIFPLSFAIVVHSLFTHPLVQQIQNQTSPYNLSPDESEDNTNLQSTYTLLLIYQFSYLIFLFAFSLLSTAAVVFTVASLYTSKPVSFSSTCSAIPPVLKRLFMTFLYVSLLMLIYNLVFVTCLFILIFALYTQNLILFMFSFLIVVFLFLGVHIYITALWHLASVVTVLEPVYGIGAMRKSYELLNGRVQMAMIFVFGYLSICGLVGSVFGSVVVHGEDYEYGMGMRVVVGGFLVVVLVMVNLIGLLVQSVFYYICKSYHHQGIDKSALNDHLGGYLGEYVPLRSSIQMENL